MKMSLQQYAKILIAGLLGIIGIVLLLSKGGVVDFADQLKPDNPDVKNEVTANHLNSLQSRDKPKFIFIDPQLQIGETIYLSDLILSVVDADGKDLKDYVVYYLADGTIVDKYYKIKATKCESMQLRFYVEDSKGLYTDKKFAITINNTNPNINDAAQFVEEWDVGVAPGTVKAKIFTYKDKINESIVLDKMTLYLTGSGKVKGFNESSVPWRSKYRNQITECIIDDTVITEDVSYWFKDCIKLERIPDFRNARTMISTFENCAGLKNGNIPETATNINKIYKGCNRITSMSKIPKVTRMAEAFYGCVNLRGEVLMEADPVEYQNCFYKVASETNGISLKIYVPDGNANLSTVNKIIDEEYADDNGSNVILVERR